jgi:lysophospholipase L1-like esterase
MNRGLLLFLSGMVVSSVLHYLGSIYLIGSHSPSPALGRKRCIVFGDSITQFGSASVCPSSSPHLTSRYSLPLLDMQSIPTQGSAFLSLNLLTCLSSTSRWVARLGEWWSRKVDVINRGFSGYNTKWALKIFDEVVLNLKPNFVIIFFGANDAAIESSSQFVSLALYEQNLSNFIQRIKEVKSSPLLVSADLSVSLSPPVSLSLCLVHRLFPTRPSSW